MKNKKPTILSLFSGAGGLDLGFKNAGFEILTSNEFDKDTFATYEHNFPETIHLGRSIVKIGQDDLDKYYDGIIISVDHLFFKKMGIKKILSFGKKNCKIFDIKSLFPANKNIIHL